jgi:hypothetical protein
MAQCDAGSNTACVELDQLKYCFRKEGLGDSAALPA